jgi:hypothetical protein
VILFEVDPFELLRRIAERAGDQETPADAERIAAEERTAAARIAGTWDAAIAVTLRQLTR